MWKFQHFSAIQIFREINFVICDVKKMPQMAVCVVFYKNWFHVKSKWQKNVHISTLWCESLGSCPSFNATTKSQNIENLAIFQNILRFCFSRLFKGLVCPWILKEVCEKLHNTKFWNLFPEIFLHNNWIISKNEIAHFFLE